LSNPTFTGDPKAPTPPTADNDTSIATTAFVKAQGYASLANPLFTGDPQAPTPPAADNDTSIATTAFVKNAIAVVNRVGDIRWGFDTAPQSNEVELNGATITNGQSLYPGIASRYAWMKSGATDLILPDARGRFARIWAHGSTQDPDRAARTASVTGGPTGDNPGTVQGGMFGGHAHQYLIISSTLQVLAGAGYGYGSQDTYVNSTAVGGNETRGTNINMSAYMRVV
jgi:hypothetical protein